MKNKRRALGIACAMALATTATAAETPLRIHGAVALHDHDTLVVFARGPAGWDAGFGLQMGTLDGMVDITGQCDVGDTAGDVVHLHCGFADGLPEDGEFLLQLFAGNGEAGVPFSLAIGRQGDIGAQGEQGDTGTQGIIGAQGVVGAQGALGATGAVGERGPTGAMGVIGPKGPVGIDGPAGAQGPVGLQGPVGPAGIAGIEGSVGDRGPVGAQGAVGPAGAVGEQGPVGAIGPDGSIGPAGPLGPQGMDGGVGPMGPTGATGSDAAVALVTRETLAFGSACAFGGQRVRSGSDFDNNGTLDPGEVQYSGLVCNDSLWSGVREFSTCGALGRMGPSDAACDTAYAGTTLEAGVAVVAGIQEWTVPHSGTYRITAAGAQGGYIGGVISGGGLGARVSADIELVEGEVLRILVGQSGRHAPNGPEAGGGGGSFVVRGTTPLVVAGGGGSHGGCGAGTAPNALGSPGNDTTAGTDGKEGGWSATPGGAGGTAGNGGGAVTNSYPGGAGGGLLTSGQYGQRTWSGCESSVEPGMTGLDADPARTAGGLGFLQGGIGGRGCYEPVEGQGGFGGGGGAGGCGGAGGGGYSGGGGGSDDNAGGGGGGSFASGANALNEAGVNSGQGRVTIDLVN